MFLFPPDVLSRLFSATEYQKPVVLIFLGILLIPTMKHISDISLTYAVLFYLELGFVLTFRPYGPVGLHFYSYLFFVVSLFGVVLRGHRLKVALSCCYY